MAEVSMPRLSDSMEEGTILKWLKSDGDEVKRGEELVEIETDKANMTYEADQDGVLEIVAKEGDTLPVGNLIAHIGGGGNGAKPKPKKDAAPEPEEKPEPEKPQKPDEPAEPSEPAPEPEQDAPATEPAPKPAVKASDGGGEQDERVKASPVARRMARELGLDLAQLSGTGPGGRIVKADVEAAGKAGAAPAEQDDAPAEAPAEKKTSPAPVTTAADISTAKGETEVQELTKLQQVIARRMAESKATAPEFVLNIEVAMEAAVELRKQMKVQAREGDPVPSFNDFVVKASALALRDFPRANGAYRDGKFELYSRVNVGIAVAAQDALVVPTVFDADKKSLGAISRDSRALAERVRDGQVTPPELSGGTFTVSNLGMFGIRRFVAVINPPQAAILAVGALEPRAVVEEGEVVVRNRMDLTLVCDHRILYGADAAEFLVRIRERLEQPLQLAM